MLAMVSGVIVARQLGPERRGYFGLVILAVNLITALGHMGLGTSVSYYTGKNEIKRSDILTFIIAGSLFLGIILGGLFFFVSPHILNIWKEIPHSVMMIGLIAVPPIFFLNFFSRFLLGMMRVRQNNITNLLRTLSYVSLVVVFVWFMKGGVRETTICFTASVIISGILGLLIFTKGARPAPAINTSLIKPFLGYGIRAYMLLVFTFLNYRVDIFLIKYFLTASDVGFYQIAVNVAERLWYIPNALSAMLFPTLLSMTSGSSRFTARVCRNSLFIMLMLAIIILAGGRFAIVLLYGEEYLPASFALYSILWGITIFPVYKLLSVDFATRNKLGISIFASLTGIAVNIAANIYLIPRYGIVGAGIATSLSYTVLSLILGSFFMREHGIGPRELIVPNGQDFRSYREGVSRGLRYVRDRFGGRRGPERPAP